MFHENGLIQIKTCVSIHIPDKKRCGLHCEMNPDRRHAVEDVAVEVRVKIGEEILEKNVRMVFHSRNPMLHQYHVNLRDISNNRWIRLYCKNEEEAGMLAQEIREGKITDLTGYPAEWK